MFNPFTDLTDFLFIVWLIVSVYLVNCCEHYTNNKKDDDE